MSEEVSSNVQEVNETVELAPEAHENAEALSFDDLDTLTDGRSDRDLIKEIGSKPNEQKQSKKAPTPEENELSDQTASDGETQQEIQQEIKKILAKQGEEDMELDANTMFTHKVDGEEVNVGLQELLNNYSGKVSYEQKFQELADQRKIAEQEYADYAEAVEEYENYMDSITNHLEQNNTLGALETWAEATGVEPHQFKRELLAALAPEIERRSLLSEEELKAEDLAAQNEYLSRQAEHQQSEIQNIAEMQDVANQIRSVQEEYGINDEDFRDAYDMLSEQEGFDQVEITADMVGKFYNELMAYDAAAEVLDQTNPALLNNDEVLDNLQQIIVDNPDFTEQDIVDIVNEVYGGIQKKASKSVSKKISNSVPSNIDKPDSRDYEDYVDWEDI